MNTKKAWNPKPFSLRNYSPKRSLIRADLPERSRKKIRQNTENL